MNEESCGANEEIVNASEPAFISVSESVSAEPASMLPKFRLSELNVARAPTKGTTRMLWTQVPHVLSAGTVSVAIQKSFRSTGSIAMPM